MVVFGCGPVGLFAQRSRPGCSAPAASSPSITSTYRLDFARRFAHVETVDFAGRSATSSSHLREITDGRGADVCIDAVGLRSRRLDRCRRSSA